MVRSSRHVPDLDPLSAAPVQLGGDVSQGAEVDAVLLHDPLRPGEHEVAQLVGGDAPQRGGVLLPRLERGAPAEHPVAVAGVVPAGPVGEPLHEPLQAQRALALGGVLGGPLSGHRVLGPYRRPAA
jgi:hypothetical protein